jgi:hypothetical protein
LAWQQWQQWEQWQQAQAQFAREVWTSVPVVLVSDVSVSRILDICIPFQEADAKLLLPEHLRPKPVLVRRSLTGSHQGSQIITKPAC